MDDATTTAKITLTPGALGTRAMARVSIGSEIYEGVVSPRQGDKPDPTAWLTGDLPQCPRDVPLRGRVWGRVKTYKIEVTVENRREQPEQVEGREARGFRSSPELAAYDPDNVEGFVGRASSADEAWDMLKYWGLGAHGPGRLEDIHSSLDPEANVRVTADVTEVSPDIIITRHPSLATLIVERGIAPEGTPVIEHATPEDVLGRRVIGVLPLHLAALAAAVTEVPIRMTIEDREAAQAGDLPIERLREIAGPAVRYRVRREVSGFVARNRTGADLPVLLSDGSVGVWPRGTQRATRTDVNHPNQGCTDIVPSDILPHASPIASDQYFGAPQMSDGVCVAVDLVDRADPIPASEFFR